MEQFAAQSPDLIFVYDHKNQQFEFISDSVEKTFGFDRSAITQHPDKLFDLIAEQDRDYVRTQVSSLVQGGQTIDIEFRLFTSEQKIYWYRMKAFGLGAAEGETTHFAGIVEEITRRKENELGLLTVKEQKNTTIQVLGHDLRAPLNTISMSMSLLNQEMSPEENKKVRELVEIVERTCRNSLDMIKEVLAIEYNHTQEMVVQKKRINVTDRIQNQIDTFQLLEKSGKNFLFHKPTESLFANTDSVRLILIIENLLSNAYKFTKPNGKIEVNIEDQTDTFLIKVSDDGIGIPDKLKPLIFDKFTKARRKGVQGEPAVGLGMHLIRTMTEQLGGRIWFESQEGIGTTFFVELPK